MLRTMAKGLVQAGVQVDVATTDDDGPNRAVVPLGSATVEDGVQYHYFPRQVRFYTFSWSLTRWLRQHVKDYDLVHIHALFSYAAIPAAYFANRAGVPYIVRPLGVLNRWGMKNRRAWLKKLSLRIIERRIIEAAAVMHYTSEQERVEAAELGITQRSVVIPNPVEIPGDLEMLKRGEFRKGFHVHSNRLVVLFLSRLDPKKGLDILLPAFALVVKTFPNIALVLAGDGEPEFVESLKKETVRLKIGSQVVWAGFLNGDEKWQALMDADLFVLPSYSENFGISVVEAMACGLPVIVTDQVAIHREIAQANAGFVSACEIDQIARSLLKVVTSDALRKTMSVNATRVVQKQFATSEIVLRLTAAYRALHYRAGDGCVFR